MTYKDNQGYALAKTVTKGGRAGIRDQSSSEDCCATETKDEGRNMPWTMHNRDGLRKYLTVDETERFLKAARDSGPLIYGFCWMIASTGCRISEVLALTRESIDFAAKSLIVECLKKRRRHVFRAIPLPEDLLRLLRKHVGTSPASGERLWPWSRMTGYRRICEVMREAGITGPHATPKGLRHGFGVRAIQSGIPLNLVQRWLGHADMKTTAIYTCVMGPEEREIASRMWAKKNGGRGATQAAGSIEEAEAAMTAAAILAPEEEDIGQAPQFRPLRALQKDWMDEQMNTPPTKTTCAMIQFWLFGLRSGQTAPPVTEDGYGNPEKVRSALRRRIRHWADTSSA